MEAKWSKQGLVFVDQHFSGTTITTANYSIIEPLKAIIIHPPVTCKIDPFQIYGIMSMGQLRLRYHQATTGHIASAIPKDELIDILWKLQIWAPDSARPILNTDNTGKRYAIRVLLNHHEKDISDECLDFYYYWAKCPREKLVSAIYDHLAESNRLLVL